MLALFAVHKSSQLEFVRIAELVRRDYPRAERSVSIERFAERHGRRPALPVADAHVVDDQVSRDYFMRAIARHMAASPADDESELALVVQRRRHPRQMNRIEGAGHGARLLVEEHRKLGALHFCFFHVIGVVETDREKLGRAADW